MIRGLRLALVWLAMLALPLHAFAGVGRMASCDPTASSVAASASPDGSQAMPMADAPMPDGDCCDGGDAKAPQGDTVHGKCTPSAACSLVAAPALPGLAVVVGDLASASPMRVHTPAFAFLTGAPERPPRA